MTTRLKPSQNQIQYLLRVGVPVAELGDLGREVGFIPPAPMPAPVPTPLSPATPARRGFFGWLDRVFRFLLCVLALAASPVFGAVAGDPQAVPTPVAASDRLTSQAVELQTTADRAEQIPLLWDTLARLEKGVQAASEAVSGLSTRLAMHMDRTERVTDQLRNELAEHEDQWRAMREKLVQQGGALAALSEAIQSQLHEVRVNLGVEQAHSSELDKQLDQALAQQDDNTAELIKKTGVQDEKIRELRHLLLRNGQSNDASAATLDRVVDSLDHVTAVLMGLFVASCGLVVVRCIPMVKAPWWFDFTRNAGLRPSPALDGSAKSRGNSVIVRQLPAAEPEEAVPVIAEAAKKTQLIKSRRDRRSARRFFRVLARRVGRLAELKSLPQLVAVARALRDRLECSNSLRK